MYLPLFVCVCVGGGGFCVGPCFVMHHLVSFLVLQSSWQGGRERAVCLALIVFLVSCDG